MKNVLSALLTTLLAVTVMADTIDWNPEKTTKWHDETRHHFTVAGRPCWVTVPKTPRPGNPWVWCMIFPGAFETRTGVIPLVKDGFYFIHMDVGNTYGAPEALDQMDAFYKFIVSKGLSKKGALLGISRGGLYVYRFATRNPERVTCIYGDSPVCDFKSWPGQKSGKSWEDVKTLYGFKDDAEALAFRGNPVDTVETLAKANIPLIHVVGDADDVVPVSQNTAIIEQRYNALGGSIEVFHKPGCGHHPHGLEDPTSVVNLIKTYTERAAAGCGCK